MSVKENFYIPDRPIAFNRDFVNFGIGITGALFLSQCVYWSKRTPDNNGWFYKTMQEWEDETGLTRFEQETARKKLKSLGLIEEKRAGVPAKLYYRIVANKIVEMLKTSMRESSKPVCGNVANKSAEMSQTLYKDTEITTENTTEKKEKDKKENPPVNEKSKCQEKSKLFYILLKENPSLEIYEKEILDFISYRKNIKKALNTTLPIKAYIQALKDLQELGYSFSFCIEQMKSNEWQTIKVDYIHKPNKQQGNNQGYKTKAQRRNEFIDEYFLTECAKHKAQKEKLEDNLDIEDVEIIEFGNKSLSQQEDEVDYFKSYNSRNVWEFN